MFSPPFSIVPLSSLFIFMAAFRYLEVKNRYHQDVQKIKQAMIAIAISLVGYVINLGFIYKMLLPS